MVRRAVVLVIAVGLTGVSAAYASTRGRSISATSAFALPAKGKCLTGGTLTVRVRSVRHVKWAAATISINGRPVKVLRRAHVTAPVKLTGLRSATIRLAIDARARDGRHARVKRTYTACVTHLATPTPSPTPSPSPSPSPTPAPTVVLAPGRWSGGALSGGSVYPMSLYVSSDGAALQDVQVPGLGLACAPGGSFADHIDISEIPVRPDGSFTSSTTQTGTLKHTTAHYTYSFSGQATATAIAGTLREDVTYNDGAAFTCTSNTLSWSVKRDTQGAQAATAPAGSYSGGTVIGPTTNLMSLYVSPGGTAIQNVTVGGIGLDCAPGGGFADHIGIDAIPIRQDGSFSAQTTQAGIVGDTPATYTYTFSGHVHGVNSAGAARIAGILREDIVYGDGGSVSCSTDQQSWAVTRDTQGAQEPLSIASGAYSGGTTIGATTNLLSFSVSPGHTQIQNVSVPGMGLVCTPHTNLSGQNLTIAAIPIQSDGSFAGTAVDTGVVNAHTATFTYTFRGQFHGPSSSGKTRVAGTLRLDIEYVAGGTVKCSTNDQSWAASSG